MKTPPDLWTIISSDNCVYCKSAKALLKQEGLEFTEFNIGDHPVLKDFALANNLFTVPQVFKNGRLVGGYDDLTLYLEHTTPRN